MSWLIVQSQRWTVWCDSYCPFHGTAIFTHSSI